MINFLFTLEFSEIKCNETEAPSNQIKGKAAWRKMWSKFFFYLVQDVRLVFLEF